VAVPVHDLNKCRRFYCEVLGCEVGRESEQWVDLNLMGHQFVLHLDNQLKPKTPSTQNLVDGKSVPVPHYGVILPMAEWRNLAERLTAAGVDFAIEPYVRFEGQIGEQGTLFFYDPSGNALEFKGFNDFKQIFAN